MENNNMIMSQLDSREAYKQELSLIINLEMSFISNAEQKTSTGLKNLMKYFGQLQRSSMIFF
jgi:hypothetical protein